MKNKKNFLNGVISLIIAQCVVKILGLVYKLYLANKQGFGDWGNEIYNSGYQIYASFLRSGNADGRVGREPGLPGD